MSLEESFRWFQQLCIELSRNPSQATRSLEDFRESASALETCLALLNQLREITISANPGNQQFYQMEFHILSCVKYSLLLRWDGISALDRQQWMLWLENSLTSRANTNSPQYLVNKAIDVYIAAKKRHWITSSDEQKNLLLELVQNLLNGPSQSIQYIGLSLLIFIVEEFSKITSSDPNLSYIYYAQIKVDFESKFLFNLLSIVAVKFVQVLSPGSDQETVSLFLLPKLLKCLNEIISWEYGELSSKVGIIEESSQSIYYPPKSFGEVILQPVFLDQIFTLYQKTRQMQQNGNKSSESEEIINEIRNLIICLSSLNGDIFINDRSKIDFGNFLMTRLATIVEPHISRQTLQLLTNEAIDYEDGGMRHEELLLLVQAFCCILNTFSLQTVVCIEAFGLVMNILAQISLNIVQEIDCLTTDSQVRLQRSNYKDVSDVGLLSTWRFEVLSQCFDVWMAVQDNFALVCKTNMDSSALNNGATSSFRAWLKSISIDIFPRASECILMVLVIDSLSSAEEETEEEQELIEERMIESLLVGISSLGRLNSHHAIQMLLKLLNGALDDLRSVSSLLGKEDAESWNIKNIFCMEKVRLCVLFLSFLLADDFQLNGNDTIRGETPVISTWILDSILDNADAGVQMLWEAFRSVGVALQVQVQLMLAQESIHPCVSPLLINSMFRFFTTIIYRFIDPNVENYSEESVVSYPFLQTTFQSAEMNSVLETVLLAYEIVLQRLPMETETVRRASEAIKAIGACSLLRVQLAASSLPMSRLINSFSSLVTGERSLVSALTPLGLSFVAESVSTILVKSIHSAFFQTVCLSLYNALVALQQPQFQAQAQAQAQGNRAFLLRSRALIIGAITGISRCPAGEEDVLFQLTDACWSWMQSVSVSGDLAGSEELTRACGAFVKDFSEHQLARIPDSSCGNFYAGVATVLSSYSTHLQGSTVGGTHSTNALITASAAAKDDAEGFTLESSLLILDTLNNLSTKEFLLSERDVHALSPLLSRFQDLPALLLFGLQIICPIVGLDSLRTAPALADKYLSFLSILTSSHMDRLIAWFNQLPESTGAQLFQIIIQQLFAGSLLIDGCSARQALQSIHLLAINQYRALRGESLAFLYESFHQCYSLILCEMLKLALPVSGNSESKVFSDRIDAFANALFPLILLDLERFQRITQEIIAPLSVSVQVMVSQHLQSMLTNRSVNLQSLDKKNRMIFVQNFRDFLKQMRAFSLW